MLPKPLQHSSCFSLSAWKSAVCVISGLWSKSPWSDFFWPEVLDGVQRVSGLVWRKVGPRQFRDSQNIRISSQNFSVSISCTEDPCWAHSASLQWYRDRGGLVLLKMLLAHLSSHLEPATAFPIWNLALGGLCCSCAVSSLEFVPWDTHLSVRVTWLSDVQLLLTSQPPNFILISRLLVKIGVKKTCRCAH